VVDYVTRNNITFDMLYFADDVFAAYGVNFEPTYVLIDQIGQIRLRESDYYSPRMSELVDKIKELL